MGWRELSDCFLVIAQQIVEELVYLEIDMWTLPVLNIEAMKCSSKPQFLT